MLREVEPLSESQEEQVETLKIPQQEEPKKEVPQRNVQQIWTPSGWRSQIQMTNECAAEFITLLNHDDYKILNVYSFTIRRKDNHFEVKDNFHKPTGYIKENLKKKPYYNHCVIAEQFIPNPDNLPEVDHINQIRDNYHLENLRRVSSSTNCKNRSSFSGVFYEYVDDIPDDSIKVIDYGTH